MVDVFVRAGDPSSDKVRQFVADHYLDDAVCVREADPLQPVPALWDGQGWVQGAEAIVAWLGRLTNIGRAP